jgi:hypothetical protein
MCVLGSISDYFIFKLLFSVNSQRQLTSLKQLKLKKVFVLNNRNDVIVTNLYLLLFRFKIFLFTQCVDKVLFIFEIVRQGSDICLSTDRSFTFGSLQNVRS